MVPNCVLGQCQIALISSRYNADISVVKRLAEREREGNWCYSYSNAIAAGLTQTG